MSLKKCLYTVCFWISPNHTPMKCRCPIKRKVTEYNPCSLLKFPVPPFHLLEGCVEFEQAFEYQSIGGLATEFAWLVGQLFVWLVG
jgi:hypothetical protein